MTSEFIEKLKQSKTAYIDEAGRGPLAGPVVIAGIVFKDTFDDEHLKKVRDSKKMSEKNRDALYDYIKKNCRCAVSIQNAQVIDHIGISGAVSKGVHEVYEKLKPYSEYTLFDGSWDPVEKDDFFTLVDADDKVKGVGAASIIAKVVHDKIMYKYAEQYPEYQFDKHKGYGTQLHRDLIIEHGRSPVHRKTFKVKGYDDNPYRKRLLEEAAVRKRMKELHSS